MLEPGNNIQPAAEADQDEKAWLALLLGWVAGFADAFGFLKLNHIFTSHLSGNSVAMGAALGQGDWEAAAHHAWPILTLTAGFFGGAVLGTGSIRLRIRRRLSVALVAETALLGGFYLLGRTGFHAGIEPTHFYPLVALLGGAMGVQSASLRRVRGHSVHTPFVTGMLTESVENAVQLLFQACDRLRNRVPSPAREAFHRMVFCGALWIVFTGGAICGSIGETLWDFNCLLAPLIVLAAVIACDLARPVHH